MLVSIFSLFIFSNKKVSAQSTQNDNKFTVETGGYSVLSINTFVFDGDYYNNFDKKPVTTYFEFKKDDSNLDNGKDRKETIKIVRKSDVAEYNVFYSSPELDPFSTYYFRAVGYFNDDENTKFYGQVLSLRTSDGIYTESIPYTITGLDSSPIPSDLPSCSSTQTLDFDSGGGVCIDKPNTVSPNPGSTGSDTTGDSLFIPAPTCSTADAASGNCKIDSSSSGPGSGLVTCKGTDCGFVELMKQIKKLMDVVLKDFALPIAAIMFAYAGFELVTSGGETSKREKAKKIFINVAIGLVIVAAAWLIVEAVLSILGYVKSDDFYWFGF